MRAGAVMRGTGFVYDVVHWRCFAFRRTESGAWRAECKTCGDVFVTLVAHALERHANKHDGSHGNPPIDLVPHVRVGT